jgi:hypothetical protein
LLAIATALAQSPAPPITPGGYPDNRYPSPPRIGQWENVLIGMFQPIPEDMTFTKSYYGLRHTETWFDSFLWDAKAGKEYKLTSTVVAAAPDGSLSSSNWLPVSMKSSPQGLVPDPIPKPWKGAAQPPKVELTPDGKLKYTVSNTATKEEITFDQKTFTWTSGDGSIELTGTLASPGTSWLLPWREPHGNSDFWLYLVDSYKIDGTYYGKAVKGYMVMEQLWANANYLQTWNLRNRIGHLMFFANEYADGTQESGMWLCGEYGSRGALVANDKGEEVLNSHDINVFARKGGNSLEYRFANGQRWEFVDDPTAALGAMGRTGLVKRVNETRKIVRHHALYLGRRVPSDGSVCRARP